MPSACRGGPAFRRPSPSPGPEPVSASVSNNDLFQEFMQTCIDRVRDQTPVPSNAEAREEVLHRSLKHQNSDLYHGHSHMKCYYFRHQCEDHFEVAGSPDHKRVFFAAGFLKYCILNWWQQHKTRMQRNQLAPMTWNGFKAFLRNSQGESNAFVGHVWTKLSGDAQHQSEKVQDWAAHLEHSQSILLEFDANNAPGEGQLCQTFYDELCQTFYDDLRPSIKLWIADMGNDTSWDDLVKAADKAEAGAKIQKVPT